MSYNLPIILARHQDIYQDVKTTRRVEILTGIWSLDPFSRLGRPLLCNAVTLATSWPWGDLPIPQVLVSWSKVTGVNMSLTPAASLWFDNGKLDTL